ncbi:hypothetical protein BSKO_06026 [Bryopsis sp. KO-2023]|nr:hypothetical protein BSKO_06026 [Bryopsis sp. KO-2023]
MGEDVETRTQGLDDLSAQWTALKVRRNVSQWRRIGTSQEVLRVISGGVKVRFDGVPRTQQFSGSFLKSETQRKEWREIRKDYLEKGAISIVDNPDKSAHVSRSFLVPKKNEFGNRTGQRLIIDLRPLNAQVLPYPVHYEDLRSLPHMLRQNDFLIKFDLKDAFFHVGIHPDHKKFFQFEVDGERFQCEVLPFGFRGSPKIYCDLIKNLVRFLRNPGMIKEMKKEGTDDFLYEYWKRYRNEKRVRLTWYLDDFLCKDTRIQGLQVA